MKKLLRLFLVAVFAIVAIGANAQVGIEAGYVNSKFSKANEPFNGFRVGATYDMTVQGNFALNYGVGYTFLTQKNATGGSLASVELKSTGHYVDIPVRAMYSIPLNASSKFFLYAGPDFYFGLAGKNKITGQVAGAEGNTTHDWYGDMKRFDVLLGAGGGIQFNRIRIKAGYDWGMVEVNKSITRNQFNVSLGFMF
ncbi:MAG: PorT family protein [Prolixibacteraceae bacterium]|nr:PorT family protein [Prolixibacteraceae bacterium]